MNEIRWNGELPISWQQTRLEILSRLQLPPLRIFPKEFLIPEEKEKNQEDPLNSD